MTPLHYLDFDTSDGSDDTVVFDALATVPEARRPALWAEVQTVLAWAHATFPDQRAPIEDGGEWDYALQATQEHSTPIALTYDEATTQFTATPGTPSPPKHTIALSITATPTFAAAFQESFNFG